MVLLLGICLVVSGDFGSRVLFRYPNNVETNSNINKKSNEIHNNINKYTNTNDDETIINEDNNSNYINSPSANVNNNLLSTEDNVSSIANKDILESRIMKEDIYFGISID